MNLRGLSIALASFAALLWAGSLLLGTPQPWAPFLPPVLFLALLAAGLALAAFGVGTRRAPAAAAGFALLALGGAAASAKRLDLVALLAALAWLAGAECAASSARVEGSARSYLRAAAPLAAAAAVVGLVSLAILWLLQRVASETFARSLDARSGYAAVLAALALTSLVVALAWALQRRAPRAEEAR